MAPLDPKDRAALFDAPMRLEDVYDEAIGLWEQGRGKTSVDRALEFFTRFYLPDDILMKSDRAAMMCSLETRAVFLDNDLVEFCRKLPHRFKFRRGQRKYLLKKAARTLLPDAIVDRKKKGFGIPLTKWLRKFPWRRPFPPFPESIPNSPETHFSGIAAAAPTIDFSCGAGCRFRHSRAMWPCQPAQTVWKPRLRLGE